MSPLFLAVFAGFTLVALASVLAKRFARIKRSYYFGVSTWGNWLPVLATGLYLALLVVNLAAGGDLQDHDLSLGRVLSLFEMIFLLMVGPLLLTRWGNLIAAGALVYFAQRLMLQASDPVAATSFAASHLLLGALTVVAILGDKMPWLQGDRVQWTAHRLRDILLVALGIGALAVVSMGMVKYGGLTRWFNVNFGTAIPATAALGGLTVLFIAWISVVLGLTRHFMLPVIALPTVLILSYITAWPSLLTVVPFVASLALSLAAADRRAARRVPYQTGYRQGRQTARFG